LKIALLSPSNADFISTEVQKLGHDTYTAPYGQVAVQTLDPSSDLYAFSPEVVVLFYDAPDVLGTSRLRPFDDTAGVPQNAIDEIESSINSIVANSPNATIIINTIPMPTANGMGRLEQNVTGGLRPKQHEFNSAVTELAGGYAQVLVHDYAALAESHGLAEWYDNRMWYLARARLARNSTTLLAEDISQLVSISTRARAKVIVVDLDNTCWGGVIGDDGVDGIVLGTDGPGLAFRSFQQALLNYRDQGVLLAVASKNDLAVVEEAFDSHPGMMLTKEDIASWQVSWDDKAASIQRIAEELDLGTDSLVFFDDNPVERLRISEAHPDVTVVDVPKDPADYVDALFSCSELSTTALTEEDLNRPEQYKSRSKRTSSSQSFSDVNQFLESLDMKVTISENLDMALPRIAQLTQKTNQFNLRTQRYSEADIAAMTANGTHRVFWLRLTDRFGDEGIVAVAIAEVGDEWFLDTMLMSCRILKRGVEQSLIAHIKSEANKAGAATLKGEYIQSDRNSMVIDFLPSIGFTESGTQWIADTSSEGPSGPISLEIIIEN